MKKTKKNSKKKSTKKTAKKTKKSTSKKKKKAKQSAVEKSPFGYCIGFLAGDIDMLLIKGTTIKKAASILAKKHDRTKEQAAKKFVRHVNALKRNGVKVSINKEKGFYKAKTKKAA